MTAAEAKAYVKPLLEKHPELVWDRRWLFLRPVRHIVRAVRIDGASGKTSFHPVWGGTPTFKAHNRLNLQWFENLRSHHGFRWRTEDSGVRERLFEQIETVALPGLHAIDDLDAFERFACGPSFYLQHISHFPTVYVYLQAAKGEWAQARATCESIETMRTGWRNHFLAPYFKTVLEELYPLLKAEDVPALSALLHRYERESIATFRLERIYEPTPFPFER